MFKNHLQNVKFYARADNFTHALHVMHVTNVMSGVLVFLFSIVYSLIFLMGGTTIKPPQMIFLHPDRICWEKA